MLRRTLVGTFFTVFVLLTTSSAAPRLATGGRELPPHVEGEVLIQFKAGVTRVAQDRTLVEIGYREASGVGASTARRVRLSRMGVREAIDRYARHPDVEYVEPNYLISINAIPNDQNFNAQWSLLNTGQSGGTPGADISATDAWNVSTDAPNVVVAVLDSGADLTHPDLSPNIFVNPGEIQNNGVDDDNNGLVDDIFGWDFADNDNNPSDDGGHGTHVSGTIAAVGNNGIGIAGVAWNTKVLPCRFITGGGLGSVSAAVSCMDYAVLMDVDIINASWTGPNSITLREAVERAYEADVLLVAAAGNSQGGNNNDFFPVYPASYEFPNIIAVAATDHDDQLWSDSHFGANTVDIAAPGENILSTWPTGYAFLSGTSMATPHVAGVAALIKERVPDIDVETLRGVILDRSDRLPQLQGIVGGGRRLNAFLPLAEQDQTAPAAIDDLATTDPDATRIDLTWTATGDDGTEGRASRYEVRYATASIDEAGFESAALATDPPTPADAGEAERMRVGGLSPDTLYYFAIRAFDEFNNGSAVSNNALGATAGPPAASVSPDRLDVELITGQFTVRTLTLRNDGEGEYTFRANPERPGAQARRPANTTTDVVEPGNGVDVDLRPASSPMRPTRPWGPPQTTAPPSGDLTAAGDDPTGGFSVLIVESGADATAIRNELAAFIDFAVVDVYAARFDPPPLELLQSYDAVILVANLPFEDPLTMGNTLADYIDGGGGLVLTLASFIEGWQFEGRFLTGGYYPFNIGTGPVGGSTLGPFDATHPIMNGVEALTGELLGSVTVAPSAELVASWANGQPLVATRRGTVAAVNLYVAGSGFWSGDAALVLHNAALWSSNIVPWIGIEPETGVVPAGETLEVQVTFNATGLIGGGYDADIAFHGNDPDNPVLAVSARLDVIGAPDLATTPETLAFGEVFVDDTVERPLVVHNIGSRLLNVSGIATDNPDFAVPAAPFSLEPGGLHELTVTFTPSSAGPIAATLTVSSNDPDEPEFGVLMNGIGQLPPDVTVSPPNMFDSLISGDTSIQFLSITNDGGSDLVFELDREELAAKSGTDGGGGPFEFRDGFEDGNLDGWGEVNSSNFKEVTDATAADGTTYSYHQVNQQIGHFNGIFRELPSVQPEYIGFWMRSGSVEQSDAYFVVTGVNRSEAIFFYASDEGNFYINADVGGNRDFEYEADTWYFIEFREIDFVDREFDCYVDTELVQENIPFRNPADVVNFQRVNLYNFDRESQAWWDEIVVSDDPPAQAIRLDPKRGVVPAGATIDVEVTFDSRGLLAGDHFTNVIIESNDPDEPVVVVSTLLNVIGSPDIEFPNGVPDFGNVFVGTTTGLDLLVTNRGTDTLVVTSATFDDPSFAVTPAAFDLVPGESTTLALSYAATGLEARTATLTLISNDIDQNPLQLEFTANGVEPPVIGIDPASIDEELFTGQSVTRIVTVTNDGGSELVFDLSIDAPEPVAADTPTGPAPDRAPLTDGPDGDAMELDGPRPDLRPHPAGSGEFRVPGPTTHLPADAPPPAGGFGQAETFSFYDGFEDGDFDDWGDQGGTGIKTVTDLTAAAGTTYSYQESSAPGGHLTGIYHSLNGAQPSYAGFWIRSPDRLTADSYVVIRDPDGRAAIFFFANDVGKLYVNADIGGNDRVDYASGEWNHIEFKNIDFSRQSFQYWVNGALIQDVVPFRNSGAIGSFQQVDLYSFDQGAEGFWDEIVISDEEPVDQISVSPLGGTVAPGESVNLTVRLDALRAESGVQEFVVRLASNDPVIPVADLPVTLNVIGAPDIELPQTELSFGERFTDTTTALTLDLSNEGPIQLVISSITSDNPAFTVEPQSLLVGPRGEGSEAQLTVNFAPLVPGDYSATLEIHSNDPDEETVAVALTGSAQDPPDIDVNPTAFDEQLRSTEMRSTTMRIGNGGVTPLTWSIFFDGLQPGWLHVAPRSGTMPAGTAVDVGLSFNAGPLAPGRYDITMRIESDDPDESLILVPVVMQVIAVPVIAVSPDPLEFDNAFVGDTTYATLQISNLGDAPLEVGDIVIDKPQFAVATPSLTVAPDTAEPVEISFAPETLAPVQATLTITSNDPFDATVTVTLLGAGELPPDISVSPSSFDETMSSFEVLLRDLTISNVAGAELEFEVAVTGRGPVGVEQQSGAPAGDGVDTVPDPSDLPPDWLAPMATLGPVPRTGGSAGGGRTAPAATLDLAPGFAKGGGGDTVIFRDDFEDGEFSDTWILDLSESVRTISTTTAADYSTKSFRESSSDDGHLTGIHQELPGLRPNYVGFWVRSSSERTNDGYFVLRDSNLNEAIFFFLSEIGRIYCNADVGGDFTARYLEDRWTFIEFKNIDFDRQKFDYYVNYQRFESDVPFRNFGTIDSFSRIDLYNFSANADAHWDEIVFATEAPFDGVRVRPWKGTVDAGAGQFVNAIFDTRNLVEGRYEAEIRITSNDPDEPEILIPATLEHIGVVNMSVNPDEIDFGEVLVGVPELGRVTVVNRGTSTLIASAVILDHPHFTTSVNAFELAPGQSRSIEVEYDPPAPESVQTIMTLHTNDPDTPVFEVTIRGSAVVPARLILAPESVEESLYTGQTSTRTIELSNPGGLDLLFDLDLRTPEGIPIPEESLVYEDDMESGTGGWSTQLYSQEDLWHRSERESHSPATSWWCGDAATGHYATPFAISTALVSPSIDLRDMEAPIRISFWENHITEPGFDQCMVDLSLDGGRSWIPLRGAYGNAPSGDSRGWKKRFLNLDAYGGNIIQVRFYFETLDATNNAFPGWFVDDVRVIALGSPFVSATPLSGAVPSGATREIVLTFDAFAFRPAGVYEALVKIASNDPFLPFTEMPATLNVANPGRLALPGELVTFESEIAGASPSVHSFPVVFPPAGPGTLTVIADGDYDAPDETVKATVESFDAGTVGGSGAACAPIEGDFPIPSAAMLRVAADGLVEVTLRDAEAVDAAECEGRSRTVRLAYPRARQVVDFGETLVGESVVREFEIANVAAGPLHVTSIGSSAANLTVDTTEMTVPPQTSATVELTWTPGDEGLLGGTLDIRSDDPFGAVTSLALSGLAAGIPPHAEVSPTALEAALPPHSERTTTKTILLANSGEGDLEWTAQISQSATIAPESGTIPPGGSTVLAVMLDAATRDEGDYDFAVAIATNDPDNPGIEVPITLHVRELALPLLKLDFTPKYATRHGTVEVYFQLPPAHDVHDVDMSTLDLNGVPPDAAPVIYRDSNRDGVVEMIVQFDVAELATTIPAGATAEVRLVGEVLGRAWFQGTKYVRDRVVVDPPE